MLGCARPGGEGTMTDGGAGLGGENLYFLDI
jgi:hypothetical protein